MNTMPNMSIRPSTIRWSRFVAVGDSFTEGLMDDVHPNGRHIGWADRLALSMHELNPELRYANLAIRGRLIADVVEQQLPEALALQPDLVSLAAGVNDAIRGHFDVNASATQLERGVRQIKAAGADAMVFAWGDPSRRTRVMGPVARRIAAYNSATRAIAAEYDCFVVDFWGRAVFDPNDIWDEDRLHLTPQGHRLAAAAAAEALGFGDETWRTPLVPTGEPGAVGRVVRHLAWARGHFAPWVVRRVRGVSSGDSVTAKFPHWVRPGQPRSNSEGDGGFK